MTSSVLYVCSATVDEKLYQMPRVYTLSRPIRLCTEDEVELAVQRMCAGRSILGVPNNGATFTYSLLVIDSQDCHYRREYSRLGSTACTRTAWRRYHSKVERVSIHAIVAMLCDIRKLPSKVGIVCMQIDHDPHMGDLKLAWLRDVLGNVEMAVERAKVPMQTVSDDRYSPITRVTITFEAGSLPAALIRR